MICQHPQNAIGNDLIAVFQALDEDIKREIEVLGPFCPGCPIMCKFAKPENWDFNNKRNKCFMNLELGIYEGKYIRKKRGKKKKK